jgi:catechol 2,3-dioxygenase-like lactoylglutathione lyase family enzyme
MQIRSLLALSIATLAAPAFAQLAAPNDAGVAMGHFHLTVRDLDVHKKFWATLGGVPVQNGRLELIQFPDSYVMLRKGEPSGGTVGTVVNHIGFAVKDLAGSMAKWKAAGLNIEPGSTATAAYIIAPDDIRIEMVENKSLAVPIAADHIFFSSAAIPEMQAWYAKTFGAKPGKRGTNEADDLPGINLRFSAVTDPVVGTKGRSLDHIGFEVKNLEEFCKRLEAQGVKLDQPYRKLPNSTLGLAFLTDPWGTYIELTDGLAPAAQ